MSRRPVHDLVPRRAMPARAVRGAVRGAAVRLDLNDSPDGRAVGRLVDERLPEESPGDVQGRLEVERAGKRAASHADLSFFTSSVSSGTALKRSATRP